MRIRKKSAAYTTIFTFVGFALYIFFTGQQSQYELPAQTAFNQPADDVNFAARQIQEHKNQSSSLSPVNDSEKPPSTKSADLAAYMIVNTTSNRTKLSIPGIWTYLPHLRTNQQYVQPRLVLSAGRSDVTLVFGIPTIRRPIDLYLLDTVQSLFDHMSEQEALDAVVIVCIAEPWNLTFENELVAQIREKFAKQLTQGSLEVIAPDALFYPDLDKLPLTLGDTRERVKWRSKQNLDYAFLMMYAAAKGKFYMQLEDDLTTVPGFISIIKNAIHTEKKDWVMLQFSSLGFIGRLFRQKDIERFLEFLLMFFSRKPCDWLLYDFWGTEICAHMPCKSTSKVIRLIRPTIFQHQGLRSSLNGRINKLKDKFFNKSLTNKDSLLINPRPSEIISSLHHYDRYSIKDAYEGKNFFWAQTPRKGDWITFIYEPPIQIQRIAFQTGHEKYPRDIIDHADVEAMPEKITTGDIARKYKPASFASTRLGPDKPESSVPFLTVGTFNDQGDVDIDLHNDLGRIRALRVMFTHDFRHWVLCQQIAIVLAGQ